MNIIKIGQLIAESMDEGFDVVKAFSDGKISKEEIYVLCTSILEVVNTFLKLNSKPQMPIELANKIADALINGFDAFQIIKVYLDKK
jgi:hypothetical protein